MRMAAYEQKKRDGMPRSRYDVAAAQGRGGILPLFLLSLLVALVLAGFSATAAPNKTFAMPAKLFGVGPNPSAIACRDLNDDGEVDIVTADRGQLADPREERPANDELSVLLGDGKMGFTRQTPSLKTGFGPYALAISNVDGLKWPDIVVANFHEVRHRDIMAFLNLRAENLFKPVEIRLPDESFGYLRQKDGEGVPLFTKPGLTAIAVQDINGDGLRDLLATAWSSDAIIYMAGDKDAIFANPRIMSAPGAPRDLRLGDLNGDGKTDMAVVYYATAEVGVWYGDGTGNFSERSRFTTRGKLPTTVRIADMNGDGLPDIIVSHSYTEDSIVIFYNDSAGAWACSQEICLGKDRNVLEREIRDIVVEDFNFDKRPDIAAACHASDDVEVLINTSHGPELPQTFAHETYSFPKGKPRALDVADIYNEGKPDLAVALWDVDAVGIMKNALKKPEPEPELKPKKSAESESEGKRKKAK